MSASAQKAFNDRVPEWRSYLESPLGSMRKELTLHVLERCLKEQAGKIKKVLDVGCGLADTAELWLGMSCDLFLCDYAPAMLGAARELLNERFSEKKDLMHSIEAPAQRLGDFFEPGFFDVVLCHTMLEYVDDARNTVDGLVDLLRADGILSCMVVNSHSESIRTSILKQDPAGAAAALGQKVFSAGLFNNIKKRTFSFEELEDIVICEGMRNIGEFGIRIFSDFYATEKLKDREFYRKAFELERIAMGEDPYRRIGRYIHLLSRKEEPVKKGA
jgi:S-adenosylmethionine-dependent methyltransferase